MQYLLLFLCCLLNWAQISSAQSGLCGAPYSTFFSANIFFNQNLAPTLDGQNLPFGSHIIAIYDNGSGLGCAGSVQWNGFNSIMVVNGFDNTLPGYEFNEPYRFVVQLPNGCLIDSVKLTYDVSGIYTNPGFFVDGALSKAASLHAVSRRWLAVESTPGFCGPATAALAAQVSGLGMPFRFAWSNGDTLAALSALPDGAYSVTVTDAYGCILADTAAVTSVPALSLELQSGPDSSGITCQATVAVSGGTSPFTFAWSNNETGPTATDLSEGPFSITITDANGCTAEQTEVCISVSLVELALPVQWTALPNPTNDWLKVTAEFPVHVMAVATMHDAWGRPCLTNAVRGQTFQSDFDLRPFPTGVYFLKITAESTNFSKTIKIVKQ